MSKAVLVVVALAAFFASQATEAASDGEYIVHSSGPFLPFGRHEYVYFVSATTANWYTAKRICASLKLKLVTLDTEAKNNALNSAIGHRINDSFWTAGNDHGRPFGKFFWDSIGALFDFTNWDAREPNLLGQERCMLTKQLNRKWNNYPCLDNFHFICEGFREPQVQ